MSAPTPDKTTKAKPNVRIVRQTCAGNVGSKCCTNNGDFGVPSTSPPEAEDDDPRNAFVAAAAAPPEVFPPTPAVLFAAAVASLIAFENPCKVGNCHPPLPLAP